MAHKDPSKSPKPTPNVPSRPLPKGAVEVEPGVYVMREIRSAFAAIGDNHVAGRSSGKDPVPR